MSSPTMASQTPTDAELVKAAQAGSLAAFEELVNRHERTIYTLARRLLRNEHDAEDVTQQTFLSALENIGGFRGDASFATWLHRIATHAALKILRKRQGLPTVSLDDPGGDDPLPHPHYIADWKESPAALAERSETRQLLDEALDQLDEKHRVVFVLRDVEGFTIRETAEVLGLSEANVKVRLLRARLQLREYLTAKFGDPDRRVLPHSHEAAT